MISNIFKENLYFQLNMHSHTHIHMYVCVGDKRGREREFQNIFNLQINYFHMYL